VDGDGFLYKRGKLHGGGEFHNVRKFLKDCLNNPELMKRFQLLCANCHRIKTAELKEYCFKRRIGWATGMTDKEVLEKKAEAGMTHV
jgi:hypothetical protein